jgi:hypothetical protein
MDHAKFIEYSVLFLSYVILLYFFFLSLLYLFSFIWISAAAFHVYAYLICSSDTFTVSRLFLFLILIVLQTVGLLQRVISSSQGLYLNTGQHRHRVNTHTYQTSMSYMGFEPTIPASERAKTVHALDRSATVTGHIYATTHYLCWLFRLKFNYEIINFPFIMALTCLQNNQTGVLHDRKVTRKSAG